jgi:two-component system response regulator RegA
MTALEASAKPLVLIVDDDDCFRRSLAIALRLEGISVIEATDGLQALECVRQQPVTLAIVDQWLGADRGDEVLESIAQVSPGTRLVSTSDHPGIASTAAARGLAVQLEKPLSPNDIIALL